MKQTMLGVGQCTAISGYFFDHYINNFHKTEIQTVILSVEWVCTSIGSKFMTKKAFFSFPVFSDFVKKKNSCKCCNHFFFPFIIDGDGKKPLRIAILEFCKLNLNKGK